MPDSPTEDPPHQPHDKLFKAGFSVPANTAALLQAELPSEVSSLIDWPNLKPMPDSFVDSHYQASHTDLLFTTTLRGHDCLIYLLFEHQSTEDRFIALRLLRYMVRIWEAHEKKHPGTTALPVILPVVLMQNAYVWQVQPRFSDLFDLPESIAGHLQPFLPDFRFHALQLAQMPFEAMRGTPTGILILRVMKAYKLERLLDEALWDDQLFGQVPEWVLELVLRYILGGDIDKAGFETRLQSIQNPRAHNTAMTLAQRYHQEGRQERHQEDVIEVLEIRFVNVPDGLRAAIREIEDESHLRRLHRTAIQCADLETFSAAL